MFLFQTPVSVMLIKTASQTSFMLVVGQPFMVMLRKILVLASKENQTNGLSRTGGRFSILTGERHKPREAVSSPLAKKAFEESKIGDGFTVPTATIFRRLKRGLKNAKNPLSG